MQATQSQWPASPSNETMRHDQMASVTTHAAPLFFVNLVVESRGGARIVVRHLRRKHARAAKQLLERLAGASAASAVGAHHASGVPDQIRMLADLRDAGVLSADEFEAKKTELLDRM